MFDNPLVSDDEVALSFLGTGPMNAISLSVLSFRFKNVFLFYKLYICIYLARSMSYSFLHRTNANTHIPECQNHQANTSSERPSICAMPT